MAEIKNNFLGGGMNKDLDERLIPEGFYRHALNIDIDSDTGSNVGTARNSKGNSIVADLADVVPGFDPDTANARTIGSTKYEADNLMYWLVAADTFDGIFEFNEETGVTSRVLLLTKATPTTVTALGFNKRFIVTGINYINGFLYWTDNNMPPRRINIKRAKGYAIDDSLIADDINVILAPPLNSPSIQLVNDTTIQSNNLSEKFLMFAYRYKYSDNEYSSFSPFSASAFAPKEYELDYAAGNNKSMTNYYNTAVLSFETGGVNVKEIQLLMHDTRSNNISIVESFNKDKLNLNDNSTHTFAFNNNKVYAVLEQTQLTRMFDNVPLKAKAQDFIGNRLAYGNYQQFYDIKDCNGDDLKINLRLSYSSESTGNGTPIQTWRSDRDYEVGIEYLDDYGRTTTVLTSENNTTYIPATQSDTGNSLLVEIKNTAPCWATGYRIVVKQSQKSYYNVFPIVFYTDGIYRWFMINEPDRDKIKIGGYVIFKSTSAGVTHSNKKYKVLELAQKSSGFISNGLPGLYFKIKVDSTTELSNNGVFFYGSDAVGGGEFIGNIINSKTPPFPVNGILNYIENPIHYGYGNESALEVNNSSSLSQFASTNYNYRITIKISSQNKFDAILQTESNSSSSYSIISTNNIITPGVYQYVAITSSTQIPIKFNSLNGLVVGDKYIINVRSTGSMSLYLGDPVAIAPMNGWNTDIAIETGAVITLQVLEDTFNQNVNTSLQVFPPSPRKYKNIEEWWWESGAKDLFVFMYPNGSNQGGKTVTFIRGSNWRLEAGNNTDFDTNVIDSGTTMQAVLSAPIRMLIKGGMPANLEGNDSSYPGSFNYNQNKLVIHFTITQQDKPTICETEPDENILEVYHETVETFPIGSNGVHLTNTADNPDNVNQTSTNGFTTSALIKLNNPSNVNSDYNGWSFGNGLESDRIKDDWNATEKQLSPRVNAAVEDYRQRRSENAICYSGIYGQNTGVNKLNEFNLSIANFKYLDSEFGAIQKLYARDTDLIVFQENKVSQVLYGKNLMYDAVGGGSVVSIPEVLGTQNPYKGEWGISQNPESFSMYGNTVFFTDARRGSVLKMGQDGIVEISSNGMVDYFKDLMRNNPYSQKLGAYDPDKDLYVLASNDSSVRTCELSISRNALSVKKAAQLTPMFLFSIETSASWTLAKVDNGFGTSWLSLAVPSTGSGNADIKGTFTENTTLANRSIKISVTYCDGLREAFTLTQARGPKGHIVIIVKNNVVK